MRSRELSRPPNGPGARRLRRGLQNLGQFVVGFAVPSPLGQKDGTGETGVQILGIRRDHLLVVLDGLLGLIEGPMGGGS